jgi:mono/diheme cytochrome c family protein
MKKFRWIIAVSLIMIVVIISCKTQFETTKASYKTVRSSQAFDRGKELAFSICAGCHYNRTAKKFIGNKIEDVPAIAGTVYSANLTHSTNGVMHQYSDAEIRYLLKTGVARDGRFLSYMLRPNMAEDDINSVIVYLRSNDPAVAADNTIVGHTHLTFIGKTFMNMHAKPIPYKQGVKLPSPGDRVALGYYLVDNLGCFHCHSKSLTQLNYLNPDQTEGYLAGGMKLKGEQGAEIRASNITPDKTTGIGGYTREEFRKALTNGQAPSRTLKPPMPKFRMLKEQEIDAIYAYLQTVPAKYNKVKGME